MKTDEDPREPVFVCPLREAGVRAHYLRGIAAIAASRQRGAAGAESDIVRTEELLQHFCPGAALDTVPGVVIRNGRRVLEGTSRSGRRWCRRCQVSVQVLAADHGHSRGSDASTRPKEKQLGTPRWKCGARVLRCLGRPGSCGHRSDRINAVVFGTTGRVGDRVSSRPSVEDPGGRDAKAKT